MAQNIPFFFGTGAQSHPQQNTTPMQPPPQSSTAFPPPAGNGTPAPQLQTQQMAFQHNGALPAIPGLDPNLNAALQNISPEQLALIAQLFQAGALPLPPRAPAAAAVATPAPAPLLAPTPAPAPAPVRRVADAPPAVQRQPEDVDMDKEEGEVEEGEDDSVQMHRDFISTPPKGPRVSISDAARRHSQQGQHAVVPPRHINGLAKTRITSGNNTAITAFILEMHKGGYTFEQLAKEVSSPKALRVVYQKLGLPITPTNGTPLATAQKSVPARPAADERKPSIGKRLPPAKAPIALDRTAYLAKLQAAKNKKTESSATSPTPPQPSVNAAVLPKPPVQLNAPESPVPVASPAPGAKVKPKTELIKQRLEALKAERTAKLNAAALSSDGARPSSPSTKLSVSQHGTPPTAIRPGLGDGLVEAAARASGNTIAPSSSPIQGTAVAGTASPTLNRGFGLPGLFTTGMPQSPTAPQPRTVVPQRPQSSLSVVQPSTQLLTKPASIWPPPATYTNVPGTGLGLQQQPFGFDAVSSAQEPFIITDSDEDSDVEIDTDETRDQKTVISSMKQDLARAVGSLRDMSAKATFQKSANSSTPGTPMTSGDPYQRKLEEIEAMNRRIAERQKRMEQNKAKSAIPVASGQATPLSEGVTVETVPEASTKNALPISIDVPTNGVQVGPQAVIEETLTTEAQPQQTTAELDEDSFDDADLYDADAGVELQGTGDDGKVGSQATTVTGSIPAIGDLVASGVGDVHPVQDIEMEGNAQAREKSVPIEEATLVCDQAMDDYEDDIDDDDLDDIYGPPATSEQPMVEAKPAATVQARVVVQSESEDDEDEDEDDEDDEDDSSDSDSDDAMNTSDASSDSGEDDDDKPLVGSAEPSDDEQNDATSASADVNETTDHNAANLPSTIMPADNDTASQLQPSTEELGVPSEEPIKTHTAFTPYESPLSRFKDFRYHSEFLHETPGGFKSITYSHQIDPNKALCPFETTGGICNDKTCPHQHFRSMALSDNDLLKFMGTGKLPVSSPEEEALWKNGLTNVVKDLRKKGQQQDVSAIARAIADYRRVFIGDPTKTLVLD